MEGREVDEDGVEAAVVWGVFALLVIGIEAAKVEEALGFIEVVCPVFDLSVIVVGGTRVVGVSVSVWVNVTVVVCDPKVMISTEISTGGGRTVEQQSSRAEQTSST